MKRLILLIAVAASFSLYSCKENAANKINEENVAKAADRDAEASKFPVITFEESSYDFGTIERGTHVEHLFKFKNTGDAPLMIVDAKSSCGCTVPQYTRDPVAPGDEGELLVKFDGSGQNQVSKTITLTTNTKSGTETLTIRAFVTPKGADNPKAVSASLK